MERSAKERDLVRRRLERRRRGPGCPVVTQTRSSKLFKVESVIGVDTFLLEKHNEHRFFVLKKEAQAVCPQASQQRGTTSESLAACVSLFGDGCGCR